MRYPHERYLRWLIASDTPPESVVEYCAARRLHLDSATLDSDIETVVEAMGKVGGKAFQKRMKDGPPQSANGIAKPLPGKTIAKVVGASFDLNDDRLVGSLDTILAVRPVRNTIEILAAKKIEADKIVYELSSRFGSGISVEQVTAFCELYWDVADLDFVEIYQYLNCFPEKEQDRDLYRICLKKPMSYVHWQLQSEALQWNEGAFITKYLAGLQQQMLNSVDPNDPTSREEVKEHVGRMALYSQGIGLYKDFLERNKSDAIQDHIAEIHERVRIKKGTTAKELPVMGDLDHMGEKKGGVVETSSPLGSYQP